MNKTWGRLARSWQRGPLRSGNGLRIIAHRGFRAAYPENTKSAFFASLGRSHMVELDVRLSLDNAVVIFHDDRLSRCSNAAVIGPKLGLADDRVANWRLSDLLLLYLGGWFGAPGLPAGPERLPTLAEMLAWARRCRMPLNVELKDQGEVRKNALLVQKSVQQIVAADCTELVLFSSFCLDMLRQALALAPFISRALLYGGPPPPDLPEQLAALGAWACHPEQHNVDAALVQRLHAEGRAVHVWTVNERRDWQRLAALGADGVITDCPALDARC